MTVPTGRRRPNAMLVRRWFLHHGFYRRQVAPPASRMLDSKKADDSITAADGPFSSLPLGQCRTLADRRRLHDQPRRQDRSRGRGRRAHRRHASGPRRMRALCALRRDGRGRRGRNRGARRRDRPRTRSRAPAIRDGARRGAQRDRLRVLGPGRQARQAAGAQAHRASRAEAAHHRLYDLARSAGRDGAGRRQGRRSCAAQGQARRRSGRSRANSFGAQCRTAGRADRRRQRRLDGGRSRRAISPLARKPALRWSSSRCPPIATMRCCT